jgi:protein-S-isoprenylcysteine O-methyltransferase Ste14
MTWNTWTFGTAWEWALRLWMLLMLVWLVMWFGAKRAKKREKFSERTGYLVLVLFGSWLLFRGPLSLEWLNTRVLPYEPTIWAIGLAITALGVGVAIWARFSLGANWSGTVTLKADHQLVRKGPYRWIRHPIYTGILLAMVGTATIRGQLVGWIGIGFVLTGFYIKARREERFLSGEFGASFQEHAKRTGMFLPKWT